MLEVISRFRVLSGYMYIQNECGILITKFGTLYGIPDELHVFMDKCCFSFEYVRVLVIDRYYSILSKHFPQI